MWGLKIRVKGIAIKVYKYKCVEKKKTLRNFII